MVEHRSPPWLLAPAGTLVAGTGITLDHEESRHLLGSLRRRTRDHVVLTDGRGTVAEAIVTRIERGAATVEIANVHRQPPGGGIILAMGVLHGQAMDWAVQKAVEVGIHALIPVLCERVQPSAKVAEQRLDHWRRLARQALKQCHRAWSMELTGVVSLPQLIEVHGCGIVADPAGEMVQRMPPACEPLLLVGPEGGLNDGELQLLDAAGWWRLRLGRHTLRAETAAVVGAALLEMVAGSR